MTWPARLAALARKTASEDATWADIDLYDLECSRERVLALCELAETARAYVYACDRHSWNALGGFGALGDALAAVEALEKEEA